MMARRLLSLLSAVGVAACSVVGVRTEEQPDFTLVTRVGAVEIRDYPARVAAETTLAAPEERARNEGFQRLFDYITGKNQTKASIAMTAPVTQSGGGQTIPMTAPVTQSANPQGDWTIGFVMPAKDTLATLPQPLDPAVRLVEVPPRLMAVLRFSGSIDPEAVAAKQASLMKTMRASAFRPVGAPVAWFYDPPWTVPFLRRNEVAVQVERAPEHAEKPKAASTHAGATPAATPK